MLAALSGSLYAHKVTFIEPDLFSFHHSITFLIMVIIGGMKKIEGAVTGAVALTFLPEFLRIAGDYDVIVYSVMLILILLFFPAGLWGLIQEGLRILSVLFYKIKRTYHSKNII